ncbi:hypothetical protein KQI52_15920 [bacterium]|nr:hypothetical protein [bacterium]
MDKVTASPPALSSPTARWLRIVGYAVAAVVFVLLRWTHIEAMLVSPVAQIPIIDSKYYLEWGQRIASGLGLGVHPFFMSPLYPLFISLAGSIGDGFTASTLHLQLLLSLGTMLLIGRFTSKRVSHPLAGPLAAVLFALYAPAIYYDGALISASLILFLTMVTVTLLDAPGDMADGSTGLRWWRIAGAGVAIGLSALARPNALILVPAFGLLFLWWAWRGKHANDDQRADRPRLQADTGTSSADTGTSSSVHSKHAHDIHVVDNPPSKITTELADQPPPDPRLQADTGTSSPGHPSIKRAILLAVVLTVATVAVIFPAMLRNVRLGGEFSLTTSSAGMNFFVGNHEQSIGLYTEVPWLLSAEPADEAEGYRQEAMRRVGQPLTDLAASRYWFGEALEWIMHNPLDWVAFEAKKLTWFFHNEEPPNNVSFYGVTEYSPVLRALGWFRFGVLFALALPALLFIGGWRMHLPRVLILAYLVANLLFFVAGEYRYPIVGVLIPLAVMTLFRIASWIRSRDPIPALRTGILVLVLILLTHIPYTTMRTIASSETDYFNWGSVSYADGDLTNASLLLSAALAERPGWEEAHLQLAFVFRDMGLHDMAEQEFTAAGVTESDLEQLAAEEEMAQQWFGVATLDTMSADALAALAAQFNILNRYHAAFSAATRALEQDSTHARAAFEQAFAQENRGRVNSAIAMYERLEVKRRDDPMIPYRIAWCYYVLGQGTKAQQSLARARSKTQQLPPGEYRDRWLAKLDEAVLTLGNY